MRFTLQPIFISPAHQFRCHLTRRRPHISYQLWFYVSVPSANFETPRMHVNVSQTTSASGRHVTEFLRVDHVTGLRPTADDVILTGRRDVITGTWNYSVLPVYGHVTRSSDAWRQIESHAISNNIRVLTAEPDEPFAFSTSSWVVQSTSCSVDVTRFRPVNKGSRSSGSGGQKVTAEVVLRDGVFEYRLKSPNNPPHIKFYIPGMRLIFLLYCSPWLSDVVFRTLDSLLVVAGLNRGHDTAMLFLRQVTVFGG